MQVTAYVLHNADINQSDDTNPSIRRRLMSLNIIFQRSWSPVCFWFWQGYIIDKKAPTQIL